MKYTHTDCVQLSKIGTFKTLNILMDYYLTGSNNDKKIARKALKLSWNRQTVYKILDDHIASCSPSQEYDLSKLCVYIDREKYLRFYLKASFNNKKSVPYVESGIYKLLSEPALSNQEKQVLQEHILKYYDFDRQLLKLCHDFNSDVFYYKLLDYIEDDKPNIKILEIISKRLQFLDLVQNILRNAITHNTILLDSLGMYLKLSDPKNIEIMTGRPCCNVFNCIQNNLWGIVDVHSDKYPISAALSIIRKEQLSVGDKERIQYEIHDFFSRPIDMESMNDTEKLYLRRFFDFLINLASCEYELAENAMILAYKNTGLSSEMALLYLAKIHSKYAYRKMSSIMLTSENVTQRFRNAILLAKCFPERIDAIYNLAKDFDDKKLLMRIQEVAQKQRLVDKTDRFADPILKMTQDCNVSILPPDIVISDVIYNLTREVKSIGLYVAVGFAFLSGLKMLDPTFEYLKSNDGKTELIIGSLQNHEIAEKKSKIDRCSVHRLNELCRQQVVNLFTYQDAFFHGKFYYIDGAEKGYVIIGSSNVSKTAYLDNRELDLLIQVDNPHSDDDIYFQWYQSFRSKCLSITNINEDYFEDFQWNSELDIFTTDFIKKMSIDDVTRRINELSDEETKYRLNLWMSYKPANIYSELGVDALSNYILFLYPKNSLAVFESFEIGNAYYTFRYNDLETLLHQVASLTKTQMIRNSNFVNRGYHLHNNLRLEESIAQLFINNPGITFDDL